MRISRLKFLSFLLFVMIFFCSSLYAESLMEIQLGHSKTVVMDEEVVTAAFGNPDIASVVVVKPTTLLINAKAVGATSLTLFTRTGSIHNYRLLVSYDLAMLRSHLVRLDKGIKVDTDTNGKGIVLSGYVETKATITAAEVAAQRFFSQSEIKIKRTPGNILENSTVAQNNKNEINKQQQAAQLLSGNQNQVVSNKDSQLTIEETITSKPEVRIINLLMTSESLLSPAMQLQELLKRIDQRIAVELVSDVFLLKGNVKTPAALARVMGIADRFVSQKNSPDIKVMSDYGGVLAGNLDEEYNEGVDPVDPMLTIRQATSSLIGRGGGLGGSGGSVAGQQAGGLLRQPLQEPKGNLAQNISRGDVLLAADGKIMSLIQVDDQPRVEIQMRIVSVDRNKTDKLGIDWRLDGGKVTIGNSTAGAVSDNNLTINLNTGFLPGTYTIQSFLKAIEAKGAASALSEPFITAVSGESSSFLVGGALPIPTQNFIPGNATSNASTITNVRFLEYGLKLIVRPTVLENGKIAVVLDQSISEPDYGTDANKVKILDVPIPSFKQRTISTVTEANDNETWAVAGLITEEIQKSLRKVPFVSEIPILGALFRSKDDSQARNELMIAVTARRVGVEGAKLMTEPQVNQDLFVNNVLTQ